MPDVGDGPVQVEHRALANSAGYPAISPPGLGRGESREREEHRLAPVHRQTGTPQHVKSGTCFLINTGRVTFSETERGMERERRSEGWRDRD